MLFTFLQVNPEYEEERPDNRSSVSELLDFLLMNR